MPKLETAVPSSFFQSPNSQLMTLNEHGKAVRILSPIEEIYKPRHNLLFLYTQISRDDVEASLGFSDDIVICNPSSPYSPAQFEELLTETESVHFNCSNMNYNAWKRLWHICDHRQRNGMRPSLSISMRNPGGDFTNSLERVLKAYDAPRGDASGGQGKVTSSLSKPWRWGLRILHRWWKSETTCAPGEEVLQVRAFCDGNEEPLPLSMRERVILDRMAHSRIAQTRAQWAAALNADQWVINHGANSPNPEDFKCNFSRNGLKKPIWRIGNLLAEQFDKMGISIEPEKVIEHIPCGKETQYRWSPSIHVVREHVKR